MRKPAVYMVTWTRYGALQEGYEYDAYGRAYILEPNFAADPDGKSDVGNPYLFTGRRVDFLDDGSLPLQYNRHRYYDYYTGRWTTEDPLGIGGASPYRRRVSPPRGAAGKPAKSAKRRGGQAARRTSIEQGIRRRRTSVECALGGQVRQTDGGQVVKYGFRIRDQVEGRQVGNDNLPKQVGQTAGGRFFYRFLRSAFGLGGNDIVRLVF
jgi:RHS repeat-associated protein